MPRRKYQFKDRAQAEENYRKQEQRALRAEWLLTAMMEKRHVKVGRTKCITVGYVVLQHNILVYCLSNEKGIHRVCGIWNSGDQELSSLIVHLQHFGAFGDELYAHDRKMAELLTTAKELGNKAWKDAAWRHA